MTHTPPPPHPEHVPGSGDDPASFPTAVIGIVSINLLVATVLLLYIVFSTESDAEHARKGDVPYHALERYHADQAALLGTYDWVDKDASLVAIPIERAVEIVTAELNEEAASGGRGGEE